MSAPVISVTGNTVALGTAQNVHQATYVLVSVTGSTARTITIANTDGVHSSDSRPRVGSIKVAGGTNIIIKKNPTDTINAGNADTSGSPVVPYGGN